MTIEAMKQALEALLAITAKGPNKPPAGQDYADAVNAITSLRQAIAEAEKQEPVAWRNAALRVGEDLCSVGPFGYYDMTAEQWLDWALSVVTVHALPPQRQPLTDAEAEMCGAGNWSVPTYCIRSIVRNAEAAHGIKGEA